MKTKFEKFLPYINNKYLLLVLRYLRFVLLLINSINRLGRRGYLIVAMPKSGSSFIEEYISKKKKLKPQVAISTIYRESFYGDSHLINLNKIDILLVKYFGVLIKTHSIPKIEDLNLLDNDDYMFLLRNPSEAAKSGINHSARYKWHAREKISHEALTEEFSLWQRNVYKVSGDKNIVNTENLKKELSILLSIPDDDSDYERVLKNAIKRNPSHYRNVK